MSTTPTPDHFDPGRNRNLRVYRAEARAAHRVPAERLDGTLRAAQAYVDRITRSAWWRRNCPPSLMGDENRLYVRHQPPRRVIVRQGRSSSGVAWASRDLHRHRGKWFPCISLGGGHCNGDVPAIADPWVIQHELAHIMDADSSGHGREFNRFFLMLARRWLGPEAATALREEFARERLHYRLARTT